MQCLSDKFSFNASGGGGGSGFFFAYVVIWGCAIILGTFWGAPRFLGIFLDCSRILGYRFFFKCSSFRNHPDFWVLIWIFN